METLMVSSPMCIQLSNCSNQWKITLTSEFDQIRLILTPSPSMFYPWWWTWLLWGFMIHDVQYFRAEEKRRKSLYSDASCLAWSSSCPSENNLKIEVIDTVTLISYISWDSEGSPFLALDLKVLWSRRSRSYYTVNIPVLPAVFLEVKNQFGQPTALPYTLNGRTWYCETCPLSKCKSFDKLSNCFKAST